jgi:hypothetical protein
MRGIVVRIVWVRRIKTAPAKEGDATRAVCKENSFKIIIGNIHNFVNFSQIIFNIRTTNRHHIAGRKK